MSALPVCPRLGGSSTLTTLFPECEPDWLLMTAAGDSRAVLCRSGVAIPLTDDHKAAREDETVCFQCQPTSCSMLALCGKSSDQLQHVFYAAGQASVVITLLTAQQRVLLTLRRMRSDRRVSRLRAVRSCSGTACV